VNRLLTELAGAKVHDANKALQVISSAIDDAKLAQKLATAYAEFKFAAQKEARNQEISLPALETFFAEAAKRRNIDRPELVRGDRRWRELWDTTDKAIELGSADPTFIQRYIETRVDQNLSDVKTDQPYTLVVQEKRDTASGRTTQRVFDARANAFATVTKFSMNNGAISLNGRSISKSDLERGRFDFRAKDGTFHSVAATITGNNVSLKMPEGVAIEKAAFSLQGVPSLVKKTADAPAELRLRDKLQMHARAMFRAVRPIRSCDAIFAP
jgi:hypothetical protein